MEKSKCPFHRILHKLQVFAGLPVPFTVKWVEGKPDFRRTDEDKIRDVVARRACGICGDKLGEYCYYLGEPKSAQSTMYTDPPMHYTCAKESMRLCPFLNGKRTEYRGTLPSNEYQDVSKRPESMMLTRGLTKNLTVALDQQRRQVGLLAGKIDVVEVF